MKQLTHIIQELEGTYYKDLLRNIYVDNIVASHQKSRYIKALEYFRNYYGEQLVEIYSAPGRSEVGGNHTDHQRGRVLATAVNLDAIAVVSKNSDGLIHIISNVKSNDSFKEMSVKLNAFDTDLREEEKETSTALVRGILNAFKNQGYATGGFCAYITSNVLIGSGLSSSAAFEVLIGTILNGLYNDMKIDMVEIAKIGQYSENVYFGKPSGLMDQMACAVGGLIGIDFKDTSHPVVNKIDFNFEKEGYSLCIVDTKGSHDNLTDEYAAIPNEMKKAAEYFGFEVLREVDESEFMASLSALRVALGDRAVLRSIHFFEENTRVANQVTALENKEFDRFLDMLKDSGDSSFKFLQNIYTQKDIQTQNLSVALAISEKLLGNNGVCRVHGGGFAGTIQSFVKNDFVPVYKAAIENVFGKNSCHVLQVRQYGGMKVI